MNWVFVFVSFGLIGILVEMLLSYLEEASEIRDERTQKEQLIQAHKHALEAAKTETEKTSSRLSDLGLTSRNVKSMLNEAHKQLTALQEAQQSRHPTRHKLDGGQ